MVTTKKTFSLSPKAIISLKEKQLNPSYNASKDISDFLTDETEYSYKQLETQLMNIDSDIENLEIKKAYTLNLMGSAKRKEKEQRKRLFLALKGNDYAIEQHAIATNKTVEDVEIAIRDVEE